MPGSTWARRVGMLTACLSATAFVGVGAASAASTVPGENIFGMGSSLQGIAQTDQAASGVGSSGQACGSTGWLGWVAVWRCTPADQSGLSNNPTAFYTVESSGVGLAEFGNQSSSSCTSAPGTLNPACDPTAGGKSPTELDAFVGTDDPPNTSQLSNAAAAAGGGVQEVTIPVAQAPVAMIFSLPPGITMGSGAPLALTTKVLANLWGSGGVPASSKCPGGTANTWCDLLADMGYTRITTGTPSTFQFLDTTSNGGGPITLMERSKGSGTTYSFRGYLYEADQLLGLSDYGYNLVTDGPSDWPSTAEPQSQSGPLGANGSGGTLAENTCESPGSAGYANLADAALDSIQPYSAAATMTTCGGTASHQVVYAYLQDNQGDGLKPKFAQPAGKTAGSDNVYVGANIAMNPSTCTPGSSARVVGCWVVPSTPTGAWSSASSTTPGTIASDPDVYDHGMSGTTPAQNYPIVAVTYDAAWSQYDASGSNLVTGNGGLGYYDDASCPASTNCNTDAGNSAKRYMLYLTGNGQTDLANGKVYYTRTPASIQAKARTAANSIVP